MKYILTQLVDATPAIRIITRNGDEIFLAEMQGADDLGQYIDIEDGYLVTMPRREEPIWFGKEAFEAFAFPVIEDPDLPLEAPSVTEAMVDHMIDDITAETVGTKTTLCMATLRNGYEIVESSSCVSPANYDLGLGTDICETVIRDKVWEHLGFLLQTALNGVRGW